MTDPVPFGEPPPFRPRVTAQVVLGLFIIVVGVLFTLDNMEVLHAEDYLQYWPVVFVAVGGLKVWQAVTERRGWFGGLIFVGIGVFMLAERIVFIRINIHDLWPLLLACLGGYLVWRGFGGPSR